MLILYSQAHADEIFQRKPYRLNADELLFLENVNRQKINSSTFFLYSADESNVF